MGVWNLKDKSIKRYNKKIMKFVKHWLIPKIYIFFLLTLRALYVRVIKCMGTDLGLIFSTLNEYLQCIYNSPAPST